MPHIAKLSFSAVLKHFRWILTKNFSLQSKKCLSQEEAKKHPENDFFSTSLKLGKKWENVLIWWKRLFLVKQVKKDKYYWKMFAPKNEPYTAELSFSSVLKYFRWKLTQKNFSSRSKKWLSQKHTMNHPEFISTTLKREKYWGKFWFDGNNFFCSNKRYGTNISGNSYAPQNVPRTAKLSFCGDLKHFRRKWTKTSLQGLKSDFLRKKLWITQIFVFNESEKWKILRKVFNLMEANLFGLTSETGQIFPKTVLLIKMSHIQLN